MSSMAFRPEIYWGLTNPHIIGFFNTIGPKPNSYLTIFILCLLGSIFFMLAIYRGVVKAKTNHYGFVSTNFYTRVKEDYDQSGLHGISLPYFISCSASMQGVIFYSKI